MYKLPVIICLLLSATLFSSCYQNMYFADRANSPDFNKQGEFKFTGAIKPNTNTSIPDTPGAETIRWSLLSPEVDVAYAITDHIAVMASYSSVINRYIPEDEPKGLHASSYDTSIGGNINLHSVEIGAGYFGAKGRVLRYGIYGNVGTGVVSRHGIILPHYDYKSKFFKFSVQPEIGLKPSQGERFAFAAGFRLTGVKYYGLRSANPNTKYALGAYDVEDKTEDVTTQLYGYLEPYVNLEVGYKYVKLNFQFGFNGGLMYNADHIGQSPYVSAGLLFHYDPAY